MHHIRHLLRPLTLACAALTATTVRAAEGSISWEGVHIQLVGPSSTTPSLTVGFGYTDVWSHLAVNNVFQVGQMSRVDNPGEGIGPMSFTGLRGTGSSVSFAGSLLDDGVGWSGSAASWAVGGGVASRAVSSTYLQFVLGPGSSLIATADVVSISGTAALGEQFYAGALLSLEASYRGEVWSESVVGQDSLRLSISADGTTSLDGRTRLEASITNPGPYVMTGSFYASAGAIAYGATVVPEPPPTTLLLAGLLLITSIARRHHATSIRRPVI